MKMAKHKKPKVTLYPLVVSFGIFLSPKEIKNIRKSFPPGSEFDNGSKFDDCQDFEIVALAVKGYKGISVTAGCGTGADSNKGIVIGRRLKVVPDMSEYKPFNRVIDDSKIDKMKIASVIDAFCDEYQLEPRESQTHVTLDPWL